MSDQLSATLSDMLMELGNIGCGRALTALSKLTSKEFVVRTPRVEMIGYHALPEQIGEGEDEMVSVMLDITGELEGVFLILLKPPIACGILEALGVKLTKGVRCLDDYGKSALTELGNIMASSYMNAVYKLTGLETNSGIPAYAVDMLGAILNLPIVRFADSGSKLLYIQNVFTIENDDFIGCTLLLPTIESSRRLVESLEARL